MLKLNKLDSFQEQINKAAHLRLLFTILIFTFIASGMALVLVYKIQNYGMEQEYLATLSALPVHKSIQKNKSYTGKDFSFLYPAKLSLSESGGQITLTHSIPFENSGICDMKGDGKIFPYLDDFNLKLFLDTGTVEQVVKRNSPYIPEENFSNKTLKISPGFIDTFQAGSLSGFSIYEGVEGCGQMTYYFPLREGKVLIVQNAMVQQLSGVVSSEIEKQILAVPGAISRQENLQILEAILKSFMLPNINLDSAIDTAGWKIYRNEVCGLEFAYPMEWKVEKENQSSQKCENKLYLHIYKPSTTQSYPSAEKPIDAILSFWVLANPKNNSLQQVFDQGYQLCLAEDLKNPGMGCPNAELVKDWSNFTINGYNAYRSGKRSVAESLPTDSIYVQKAGYFLVLDAGYYNVNDTYDFQPIAEKIFKSLKILEEPLTGWKTYRNEEYGFEFKYPSSLTISDLKGGIYLSFPKEQVGTGSNTGGVLI